MSQRSFDWSWASARHRSGRTSWAWSTSSATRRSRVRAVVGATVAAGVWKLEDDRLPRRGGG
jgi:hypothetical protein